MTPPRLGRPREWSRFLAVRPPALRPKPMQESARTRGCASFASHHFAAVIPPMPPMPTLFPPPPPEDAIAPPRRAFRVMGAMHTGSCLCGAVRFEIAGDLPDPDACHCTQCRKTSGHYFVSTDAPRSAITIHGAENLTWYR